MNESRLREIATRTVPHGFPDRETAEQVIEAMRIAATEAFDESANLAEKLEDRPSDYIAEAIRDFALQLKK